MKKTFLSLASFLFCLFATAQIQIDKTIDLTGGTGERSITNLELPVNGTDAVNKDYVDTAVAASGSSTPTQVSNESGSAQGNFGDALRYCSGLNEGGHSDWYLPTFDEITYLMSKGGVTVSNNTSSNSIWTRTKFPNALGTGSSYVQAVVYFRMSTGETINAIAHSASHYVRCIR